MRNSIPYFVNGELTYVPEDELDQFFDYTDTNLMEVEEGNSVWLADDGGSGEYVVPASQYENFMADASRRGLHVDPLKTVEMDDGQRLTFGEDDIRILRDARRSGVGISRKLADKAFIPRTYTERSEDREKLTDRLLELFPEEQGKGPDFLQRKPNLGDTITEGVDAIRTNPTVAGAVGAVKGFGEGLARSVTDSDALWRETYGDDVADMLQNANANIGGLAKKIAELGPAGEELLAEATKFMDPEGAERLREEAAADRRWIDENINTQRPKLANDTLDAMNEWTGDTLNTIGTFAIPGSAAVDISAQTANAFYDAYDKAMKAGSSADKAEALATAKAGATAAMGVVLGKAAKGARSAAGFKGALADMAVTGGEMGVLGGVNEVIDEGIEGSVNPDWKRVGKKTIEETVKGSAFGGVSRLAHGIAGEGHRKAASDEHRAEQERVDAARKAEQEAVAKERYESTISEEARNDIENRVNDMVKTGVVPSYRHAEEIARLAEEKLGGRERGESTEAVEQAVMEAAQEVQDRLNTTERIDTPALERRQAEAEMRESERQTRLAEDYERREAEATERAKEREGAMINADIDAQKEAYERRKKDIEAAFERGDTEAVKQLLDEQKAEMEEYERKEADRKARETAEEAAVPEFDKEETRRQEEASAETPTEPSAPTRENRREFSPEYDEWLKKSGKADIDKNWNRFVAENDLPEDWKMRDEAKDQRIADEKAATNAEEERWEMARLKAEKREQDEYNAKIEEYEEDRYRRARAKREAEVKADWEAAEADRLAREREKSAAGVKEREERKAALKQYEKEEAERKAREAAEEEYSPDDRTDVVKNEDVAIERKTRTVDYPEYAEWLSNGKRKDSDKNWAKFVRQNELDPALIELYSNGEKAEKESRLSEMKERRDAETASDEADTKAEEDRWAEASAKAEERAQREYDERMTAYEEARAKRAAEEAAKKRGEPVKELTEVPEKPVQQSIKTENSGENDYPTVVDKSGKRRLTGIAAQRKAATEAEQKMRDRFSNSNEIGSVAFAEWNRRGGRLFSEPPYRTVRNANGRGTHKEYYGDPAAEAINHLLDGQKGADRERLENLLFGKKGTRVSSKTTGNDTIHQGNDYERVIDDFMKAHGEYEKFVKNGGKTNEELKAEFDEAEARAREVKIDGDSYDIEDIEAHKKADKVYYDAVAEVDSEENGKPYVKNFSRDELKKLKKGDTIRFDHSEADYDVESYDTKNNEIVVTPKNVMDNPLFTDAEKAEMKDRRFRLTENGWIELNKRKTENGNERTNAEGTDENLPGDAKGKRGEDLSLDGGTAEEIAAEKKRIADKAEIERRQNAPLKTGKGEIGQGLLDLGGAEGEDLFNRTQKPSTRNESVDLERRATDPKRRSDPKAVEWAKKKGHKVVDGKVSPDVYRAYNSEMLERAAKATKRWIPDVKVTIAPYGDKIERGKHFIDLHEPSGATLGYFDPKTKEVVYLPGADIETVPHELMWHAARDLAKTKAEAGDERAAALLKKMKEVEDAAPPELKGRVLSIYKGKRGYTRDTFMNEFGAWFTQEGAANKLLDNIRTADERKWFAKAFAAVKESYKDFLTDHGKNRVNLDGIEAMGVDEFTDFLGKSFAEGKTLGKFNENAISTGMTKVDRYKQKMYDVYAPIRKAQEMIEKKIGRKLTDEENADYDFALAAGLRDNAVRKVNNLVEDYGKLLKETGLTNQMVEEYMAYKASKGRDEKIDRRNIEELRKRLKEEGLSGEEIEDAISEYKSTNGSHIDPKEAADMITELEGGEYGANLKRVSKWLRDNVINKTLETMVENGTISKETMERLMKEEPDYVPFKNAFDPESGDYTGRSASDFSRPTLKTAKGRKSSAGDIVAHMFMDIQSAHENGIRNKSRQTLANLIRLAPELGEIVKTSNSNRIAEKRTGSKVAAAKGEAANVINFKVNGEDFSIRLKGELGEAIASGVTERDTMTWNGVFKGDGALNKFMRGVGKVSRGSAGLATRHTLTFPMRNAIKDNIELSNIVLSEHGPVNGAKWYGHYLNSQKKTAGALYDYIKNGRFDETSEGGKILNEYLESGGRIAGGVSEGMAELTKRLSPEQLEKDLKRGDSKMRAIGKHTLKSISYINEFAELATRVNSFAAERAMGKSAKEAAVFSRRATVDFNRHGEYTGISNVIRMFSNSTTGATARAAAALAKSKYGKGVAATLFAARFAATCLELYMNDEDDKRADETGEASTKDISEFDRKTSWFGMKVGGKYHRVPQHESPFTIFSYAGDVSARVLFGRLSVKEGAKLLGVSAAEMAAGLAGFGSVNFQASSGKAGDTAKAIAVSSAPSLLQPAAEVMTGIDYKGDRLYRPKYDDPTPESHVYKSHTPEFAVKIAQTLNAISGGDDARAGWLDVSPNAIEKLVEGYGKNTLRDVTEAYGIGKAVLTGTWKDVDDRNKPFKRDFSRPIDGNTRRYYDAMREHKTEEAWFSKKAETLSDDEFNKYLEDHPSVGTKWAKKLINDIKLLYKMEEGKVRNKSGRFEDADVSDEDKEWARKERLRLQAEFIRESKRK